MSDSENKPTDQALIKRFTQGDDVAFDTLVERYASKAYQIAYGVLGSQQDAEEVSQDVFVRIHRALPKFRGDAEFSTWMYRIAINLARNKYRWNKSRGAKKNFSIDAPIEGEDGSQMQMELPEPRMQPDEQNEFNEFESDLVEELHKLPPVYREALVLRNVEDMSYEEIAQTLGCKLGTIKSRIARARDELRRRMGL